MFKNAFNNTFLNVKNQKPLVHCITNYVTVNDCANILLASGGSPIMADDIAEVVEITSICNSLVINIGTLNARTISSMKKAGITANALNHVVILDPVGAGASTLRTETTNQLMADIKFSVIRGNISEIKTIAHGTGSTKGVDANDLDKITDSNLDEAVLFAKELSEKTGAVIAITGEVDIVANHETAYVIKNGHAKMSEISGTGCMLTAVIGAYAAANNTDGASLLDATAAAVCAMGLSGERAYEKMINLGAGTSTYKSLIIDEMSNLTEEILTGGLKIEKR